MTRTLAVFIAQGYMAEDNSAVSLAQTLSMDTIERQVLERQLAEPPAPTPEPVQDKRMGPGSYERFMSSLGSPGRWRGGG